MLNVIDKEDKRTRAWTIAKSDKVLATACARVVQLAVLASQKQLKARLQHGGLGGDSSIEFLMNMVRLDRDHMDVLTQAPCFQPFKAEGFKLGPVAYACHIFLADHLRMWVDGESLE